MSPLPAGEPRNLLFVSFGGPEGPDDVVPFLERVTRGRGIPRERLVEVGAHYAHFGGVSPINEANRGIIAAVEAESARRGRPLRVFWGNRNWHPLLDETAASMASADVGDTWVFLTSAYSSYSGCRQYREDLAAAFGPGPASPTMRLLRQYYDREGFLGPFADGVVSALARLSEFPPAGVPLDRTGPRGIRLVFTTHSIPTSMAAASGGTGWPAEGAYVTQHRSAAVAVVDRVAAATGHRYDHDLVFQSRSGPPTMPWLEPDVGDHLRALASVGVAGVVIVPIGFVSDHVEVLWDLDEVALGIAAGMGLPAVRSATPGTDPRFAAMVCDLVEEDRSGQCPPGCCPNPRDARPARCGSDPISPG